MTTTRRPKLLRDVAVPWRTVPAGTILPRMGNSSVPQYGVQDVFMWAAGWFDARPDWFAWVDVCDDCGREVARVGMMVPMAEVPRFCHGHAPKPPYPMGDDESGYVVHGDGKVDAFYRFGQTGYPVWRTRADAERFAARMKTTALQLQHDLNVEAAVK